MDSSDSRTLNCSIEQLKPSTGRNYLKIKKFNGQIYFFKKTMINIFHHFIPNKDIICNYKYSPWYNNQIKTLIEEKNVPLKITNLMVHCALDHVKLQNTGAKRTNVIKSSKENFYINLGKN